MAKGSFQGRSQANPYGRFESFALEWEEEAERTQPVKVFKETAKSIVTENASPDIPFRYSVNPYRGCVHACAYCYARPTHEYLGLGAGTDFETQIYAKINAAELLRKKLGSKSWKREAVTFSGITDCYQAAEHKLGLTRACLEACLEFDTPVSIITKSPLVIRDLDILTALARGPGVNVVFSVPFLDKESAAAMEPFAPQPEQRFKAMGRLSRAGIRTGLSIGPVVPGLNDSEIPALLSRASENGASFAFCVLLRLPGSVREVFLEAIRTRLPSKAGKIEHHIRNTRGGELYENGFGKRMAGTGEMAEMVSRLFSIHARRLGLEVGEGAAAIETPMPTAGFRAAPEPTGTAKGTGAAEKIGRTPPRKSGAAQLDLFG